jgi:hypothetical protein
MPLGEVIKAEIVIARAIGVAPSVPYQENSMSPSAVAGSVKETVTRERVVPAAELASERKTPEFWTFVESMTPEMWSNGDYALYILREDPKPSTYGGTNTLEKCTGYIDAAPGVRVPLEDREEIELAIKHKYGGRAYRLILKKGHERLTEGKCVNEAPPKYPEMNPGGYHPGGPLSTPPAGDATAQVANKAMETVERGQQEPMRLAMEMLSKASELVFKQTAPPASTLTDQVMQLALKKLLEPPPPPPPPPDMLKIISEVKTLFGPPAPTNTVKEIVETIAALKTAAADLIPRGDRTNIGIELARQVPSLIAGAQNAVHDWRMGMEAQERGAAIVRGGAAPIRVPAPNPPAAAATTVLPVAPPPPATQPGQDNAQQAQGIDPPLQWVEYKIVDILAEASEGVDDTVEQMIDFLYIASPKVVPWLITLGEQGVLNLFQTEEILRQVPVTTRLAEFIKKFVVAAKAAEAERQAAVATVAPEAGKKPN